MGCDTISPSFYESRMLSAGNSTHKSGGYCNPQEISKNLLVFFQNNCKMLYCFGWSFIWPEESAQVRVNEVVIVEEINFKLRSAL